MDTTQNTTNFTGLQRGRRARAGKASAGVIVAALALATAGCGGSSHAVALNGPAFTAKASSICTNSQDAVQQLTTPTLPNEIPAYAGKSVSILDRAMSEFRSIQPPADEQAAYGKFLGWFGKEVDNMKAIRDAGDAESVPRIEQILGKVQSSSPEGVRLASELHLIGCEDGVTSADDNETPSGASTGVINPGESASGTEAADSSTTTQSPSGVVTGETTTGNEETGAVDGASESYDGSNEAAEEPTG